MIRNIFVLAAAASLLAANAAWSDAQERTERTGSRLASDSTPRTVYRLSPPAETQRVLRLLEQGETERAVELARDYLASLRSAVAVGSTSAARERYFALNALCAALTSAGEVDEAVAACSEAVELWPSQWTALNSRGTAYYVARDFERAAADYERALDVAPSDDNVVEVIEHNLRLTAQRLAETRER